MCSEFCVIRLRLTASSLSGFSFESTFSLSLWSLCPWEQKKAGEELDQCMLNAHVVQSFEEKYWQEQGPTKVFVLRAEV